MMKDWLNRLFKGRAKTEKESTAVLPSSRPEETELPDLEAVCGDDIEVYEALRDTMFLTPWLLTETMEEAAEKGSYKIAGGLALYKGDVEKVREYFRLTGRELKILDIPERDVEKAQEYYAKCPKLDRST